MRAGRALHVGRAALVSSVALLAGCGFNPCVNGGDIEDDSDGDTIPDCVEEGGVDINDDGTVDAVTNTNPRRKDIFVKIDWMDCDSDTADSCSDGHDHEPNPDSLDDVVQAFADAPVDNPDGSQGIDLRIELGEALPHQDVCDCECIASLVDDDRQVLSASERSASNANELFEAKRKLVHYLLWSHQHTEGSGSSGVACGNGYTHVSLGTWSNYGTRDAQSGTFMHELGHQLGLPHGGSDGINNKPNYLSVMNYAFQTSFSGRLAKLDYSTSELDSLNEDNLDESVGIGPNDATQTRFFDITRRRVDVSAQGGIDWNQDGDSTDIVMADLDLNNDGICISWGDDDDFLDSRKGGDDQYFARNRSGWMVLGDAARAAVGDDDKWIDATSGETRVSTGPDTILDTSVEAGDTLFKMFLVNGPDNVCDSTVDEDDKEEAASGAEETRVLTGHDDWDDIELDKLFNLKGGFGETPPSNNDMPDEEELTFEESIEQQPSDVVVDVVPSYTPRRGQLVYSIEVSNAGPAATDGPAHVDLWLPATSANVTCQVLDQGTCVLTADGDKILIDTPQLEAGDSDEFEVTLTVDAASCDSPEDYVASVSSSILNVELDHDNDTYGIEFPDADGDGTLDVCAWPVTDFSLYGLSELRIGNSGEVVESSGSFAHGLVARRSVGGPGLGEFRVGVRALTGDAVSNGGVVLDRLSMVDGNVVVGAAATLRNGASITGSLSEGVAPSPELPPLELFVDFSAPSLGDALLEAGNAVSLAPGRYGSVVALDGSDLFLGAGDYLFDTLELGLGSRIHLDTTSGPIRIFVSTTVVLDGGWVGDDASAVLLAYAGTDAVIVSTAAGATLLAPRARVHIGTSATGEFTGAVLADTIHVQPDVRFTHVAFRGTWPWNP